MKQRTTRVWILCIAISLLGLTDLYLTIRYVKPGCLMELNPIAIWLMDYGPFALTFWKMCGLSAASYILIQSRHRLCGEIASWGCFGLMLVLLAHWFSMLSLISRD